MALVTLQDLRRYAVARSFFSPTSLGRAIAKLGFVQADPIRSPARAQDLILRHRVKNYVAGDLEKRYGKLAIEEDFFVNYGFLPRATADLMHPRTARYKLTAAQEKQSAAMLDFIRERGAVHPTQVDAHFQHGKTQNWFGGQSRASTQLLDALHYRGKLRTAQRKQGIRCYEIRNIDRHASSSNHALDTLVDVIVNLYAPLPAKSMGYLCSLLMRGVPQWADERSALLVRTKARLASAEIDGTVWYWPANEDPRSKRFTTDAQARLLAPFDPIVWDRTRFELLWGWTYKFEAYTPAPQRMLGYYAMPLILGDDVIGWGNVDAAGDSVNIELGLKQAHNKAKLKAVLAPDLQALCAFLSKPLSQVKFIN